MPSVSDLLYTSDFDTLKNDDYASTTVTIPANSTVDPADTREFNSTMTVGSAESLVIAVYRPHTEVSDAEEVVDLSATRGHTRTGVVSGAAASYTIAVRVAHTSSTSVALICSIFNGYSSTLTTQSADDVFTVYVRTLKKPRFG